MAKLRIWRDAWGYHIGFVAPNNGETVDSLKLGWAAAENPPTVTLMGGGTTTLFKSAACSGIFRVIGSPKFFLGLGSEKLFEVKFGKDDVTFGRDSRAEANKLYEAYKKEQDATFEQRVQAEVNARLLQAPVATVATVKPKRKYVRKAKPATVAAPASCCCRLPG